MSKVKENKLSNRTAGQICNRDLTDINATNTPSDMLPQYFDLAMRYISEGLGIKKYYRVVIEKKACESNHGQITIEKFKVYVQGSSIYTLSQQGGPTVKKSATYTWILLQI